MEPIYSVNTFLNILCDKRIIFKQYNDGERKCISGNGGWIKTNVSLINVYRKGVEFEYGKEYFTSKIPTFP